MSTKQQISREDFYKLTGLLTLAREHNSALDTITRAAAEIVGESPDDVIGGNYFGHVSDAISEGYSVELLLSKLEIGVSGNEEETG